MKAIVFGLMLVLGLVASARADWQINRHDCESPAAYLESNANAIAVVATSIFSAGMQDTLLPDAQSWAGVNYIGLSVSVLKGFFTLGITPVGTANIFLGLVCLKLEDSASVEASKLVTMDANGIVAWH